MQSTLKISYATFYLVHRHSIPSADVYFFPPVSKSLCLSQNSSDRIRTKGKRAEKPHLNKFQIWLLKADNIKAIILV